MDNLTAGNPRAHRVRVYYDGSSTIAEGMPLCYNYLTTDNWWGGSVSDEGVVTANETTAEGSHNKGKYIYVSNPTCVSTETDADGAVTDGGKIITGDGDDFDDLQVGMFVSVSSVTDDTCDGNYKITAHNVAGDTITLEMVTAFTTAIAGADDVVVKMDNIHEFAGVVTKGGWCGKTGPRVLDIYVPNGAIVPVLTDLTNTYAGRTILSVVSATQTLGSPTQDTPDFVDYSDGIGADDVSTSWKAGQIDSQPVAIAAETITSAGLVLAKLDDRLFMFQGGQYSQEYRVESVADDVTVNKMNIEFNVTAGHCQALHYRSVLAGTGGDANRGVYRFETFITGVPGDAKHIFGLFTHLEIGSDWNNEPGATGGHLSPLFIGIRTKNVNPNLSGVGILCMIHMDWILRKTTSGTLDYPPISGGSPHASTLIYINSDSTGTQPDYFFVSEHNATVAQGTDAKSSSMDCARTIKVCIGNIDYYIPTYTLAELTT